MRLPLAILTSLVLSVSCVASPPDEPANGASSEPEVSAPEAPSGDATKTIGLDALLGTEQVQLTANDGTANNAFAYTLALSGDTALVGGFQGAAYVFTRSGGVWTQQQKLTPSDPAGANGFAYAVALSGDTALVGAYKGDGVNTDQGAAYMFTRSGGVWTETQKLVASDGVSGDYFGTAVALEGDTAVIGAAKNAVGMIQERGAAYVFTRANGVWTQQQKLSASDGAAGDYFGTMVALSGDSALVGAFIADVGANTDQGAAYVFTRNGAVWSQQQKLTASDGGQDNLFGGGVAISGDTALVGAVYNDVGGNNNQGAAYVYTRSGAVWSQQQKLTASDGAATDGFGVRVALEGNTALVGAFSDDTGANTGQGSAYVFTRTGAVWTQEIKLTASDGAAGDTFGRAVSLSGNTALVGAEGQDVGANMDQGSAYVFQLGIANGQACGAGIACYSGFCVDGACCNVACGSGDPNDCQVCSVAAGAAVNGVCAMRAMGTMCRASGGMCDVAEACDGVSGLCPADAKVAAGTECRAKAGDCDVAESCDGAGVNCPADAKVAAGTECRAKAGDCDVAESCDGAAVDCRGDMLAVAGTECRAAAGDCDVAESCDGAVITCPIDENQPDGSSCAGGTCANGICMGGGGSGGSTGAGGSGGVGGSTGVGGSGGMGGSPGVGGSGGMGGSVASSSSSGAGGSAASSSSSGAGGSSEISSSSGSGGSEIPRPTNQNGGCECTSAGAGSNSAPSPQAFAGFAFGALLLARRRSRAFSRMARPS